jgi:hypothetical protein
MRENLASFQPNEEEFRKLDEMAAKERQEQERHEQERHQGLEEE